MSGSEVMRIRVSKERAKEIRERPGWVLKDRDWEIFKDYRDSRSSADDLAVLWHLSRAQVQNILSNILTRFSRPGELSTRAVKILENCGARVDSPTFIQDLDTLELRAVQCYGSLEKFFQTHKDGTGCGAKTLLEILDFYASIHLDRTIDSAA